MYLSSNKTRYLIIRLKWSRYVFSFAVNIFAEKRRMLRMTQDGTLHDIYAANTIANLYATDKRKYYAVPVMVGASKTFRVKPFQHFHTKF